MGTHTRGGGGPAPASAPDLRQPQAAPTNRKAGWAAHVTLANFAKVLAVFIALAVADVLTDKLAAILNGIPQESEKRDVNINRRMDVVTHNHENVTTASTIYATTVGESTVATTKAAAAKLELPKDELGTVIYKSEWPQKMRWPESYVQSHKAGTSSNVHNVAKSLDQVRERMRSALKQKVLRVQQLRGR